MYDQATELIGEFHVIPFDGRPLPARVQPVYEQLLKDVGGDPRDVLVIKRLPDGVPEFTAALRDRVGLQARPNVKSVARHASSVISEADPETTWLTYAQRIEFLAAVLNGYDWGEYFDKASDHDSFGSDVGQLLLNATWQGGFDIREEQDGYDELIAEIADVNEAFHEKMEARDLAEQAETVPQAVRALEDDDLYEQVVREFDAVLAIEFEEYSAVEREYLATLTDSVPLACVGEANASIDRIKKESGDVRDFASKMTVFDHTSTEASGTEVSIPEPATDMAGAAYAEFLKEGEVTHEPDTPARLISAETFDEEIQEVANEIEYLRQEHDWEYDDFSILLRSVGDPMPRVRRVLRHAGIPTASAGVSGLEQDLAVRELHALAQYYIDSDEGALELLEVRVPSVDDDLIQACVDTSSIANSLKRWIVSTDLKDRIASKSKDIDAREQFQNISRLLTIAEFVDEQDFLTGDWYDFRTMLDRAITYDASYAHTAEVDVPEGGVTLGDVALLKNESNKVVFMLNVVDSEYPGSEPLSQLFPTTWIKQMAEYPAVTTPTADDVISTFETAESLSGNEFERYHAERARRKLAVGARAAEEKLYFCTHDGADSTVGGAQHNSRYLHEIQNHPDLPIETVDGAGVDRDYYTLGSASAKLLAEPWSTLEEIQAIASRGGGAQLETKVERWAKIQKALEESESASMRFIRAVETQFDLARGALRPTAATGSLGGEAE